jgi:hypothetical protein
MAKDELRDNGGNCSGKTSWTGPGDFQDSLRLSASDFRARWRAVAEREAEERRGIPPAVRWQQLNALLAFAAEAGLDWKHRDEQELLEVRRRWIRIKEAFEGNC